jgi:hypothetical protein
MKIFSLLWLFPYGAFCSGNTEVACFRGLYLEDAIDAFRARVPMLDDFGYLKDGEFSWVIAESY